MQAVGVILVALRQAGDAGVVTGRGQGRLQGVVLAFQGGVDPVGDELFDPRRPVARNALFPGPSRDGVHQ